MAKHKIRIRLKAYDHRVLDQSAKRIVETAERTARAWLARCRCPAGSSVSPSVGRASSTRTRTSTLRFRTHKRLIDVLDPDSKTIDTLMRLNLPAGVDIEIKI